MYYDGVKAIIESTDLRSLRDLHLEIMDGEQLLTLVFVVDESRKDYSDGSTPAQVHLTDGVSHRTLVPTPKPEPEPAQEEPASEPELPLQEAPATDRPPTIEEGGPVEVLTGDAADAALAVEPQPLPEAPVDEERTFSTEPITVGDFQIVPSPRPE